MQADDNFASNGGTINFYFIIRFFIITKHELDAKQWLASLEAVAVAFV